MILRRPFILHSRSSQERYWHAAWKKVHCFCQEATSRSATDADIRFNPCYRHKHVDSITETTTLRRSPSYDEPFAVYPYELLANILRSACLHRSLYQARLSIFLESAKHFILQTLHAAAATRHGVSNGADADSLRALRQSKGEV